MTSQTQAVVTEADDGSNDPAAQTQGLGKQAGDIAASPPANSCGGASNATVPESSPRS